MGYTLHLPAFNWLVQRAVPALLISIPIIFQPELRRALAELGSHRWFSPLGSEGQRKFTESLTEIVSLLSRKRVGSLIAI
jgi:diadenylate cyclase